MQRARTEGERTVTKALQEHDMYFDTQFKNEPFIEDLGKKIEAAEAHTNELEKLRREEQLARHEAQDENKILREALKNILEWAEENHARPGYSEVIYYAREALKK